MPSIDSQREFVAQHNPHVSRYGNAVDPTGGQGYQQHFQNAGAWNTLHQDSKEADDLRMKYETQQALRETGRTQDPNFVYHMDMNAEENYLRRQRDVMEEEKEQAYMWAQADPAQPWTMELLARSHPHLIEKKSEIIHKTAQMITDILRLKHIGHGGDPHLMKLQYMLDNNMLGDVPRLVKYTNEQYEYGPYSIWNFVYPGSTSADPTTGAYNDSRVNLARTSNLLDGHTSAGQPHITRGREGKLTGLLGRTSEQTTGAGAGWGGFAGAGTPFAGPNPASYGVQTNM